MTLSRSLRLWTILQSAVMKAFPAHLLSFFTCQILTKQPLFSLWSRHTQRCSVLGVSALTVATLACVKWEWVGMVCFSGGTPWPGQRHYRYVLLCSLLQFPICIREVIQWWPLYLPGVFRASIYAKDLIAVRLQPLFVSRQHQEAQVWTPLG